MVSALNLLFEKERIGSNVRNESYEVSFQSSLDAKLLKRLFTFHKVNE